MWQRQVWSPSCQAPDSVLNAWLAAKWWDINRTVEIREGFLVEVLMELRGGRRVGAKSVCGGVLLR